MFFYKRDVSERHQCSSMLLTPNAENPSRALAYVRVSSQRQVDEGVSIEAQIKRIKEYARYKGLEIDRVIIIEEGVSGGVPIWERPAGNISRDLKTESIHTSSQ